MTELTAPMEGAVPTRRPFVSRKVSPELSVAILFAFGLPFGTVLCDGPPVEFTGYELATWRVQQTTPPAKSDDGESLPTVIERKGSAMAFVMLVSAALGLVLGLAGRRGAGIAVAIGLVGAFVLWVEALDINNGAEPKDGFMFATVLLIGLALWHAVLAIRRRRLPPVREPMLLPPGAVSLGLPEHPTRR